MEGLLISLDRLRVHLRKLNASAELADREITLQCVFLVDLEGLSIQSVVCSTPFRLGSFSFIQSNDRTLKY
jgi:hypothetical protein